MKLYDIVENIERLNLDLEDGKIDEQTYLDTVESLDMDLTDKCEAIVRSIRNEDSYILRLEEEIMLLKDKREKARRHNEGRKQYLKLCLDRIGVKRLDAGIWKLAIQNNGGLPPLAKEGDPSQLPERFRKVTYSPIKDEIKRALMNGETIEGWELGEQGESLRIK